VTSSDSRHYSFYALLATVVAVGLLFYRVAQPFLLPIFLAAMLAVIFRPLHERCAKWCRGHRHVAAALVTAFVLLIVLLPISVAVVMAGQELFNAAQEVLEADWREHPVVARTLSFVDDNFSQLDREQWESSTVSGLQRLVEEVYKRSSSLLSNVVEFVIGVAVVTLGLFYFLADGPAILKAIQRVSPLDDDDEVVLFREFGRVCRGVIVASVTCAVTQGVLAGIGFAMIGIEQIWLLAILTACVSFLPVLGASSVWICVALSLVAQQQYGTALALTIYGGLIISTSDNLIRAYVIHGTVGLHPFVAFVSVLGAIHVAGLWGIFLGPIVAAFFYALLKILQDHTRLNRAATTAQIASET